MGFTHLLAGGVQAYRRIVADCVPGRWGWPDLSAARPELRWSRQIKGDVGRQNSGPPRWAARNGNEIENEIGRTCKFSDFGASAPNGGKVGRPGSAENQNRFSTILSQ